jgi:hypothetical protein
MDAPDALPNRFVALWDPVTTKSDQGSRRYRSMNQAGALPESKTAATST